MKNGMKTIGSKSMGGKQKSGGPVMGKKMGGFSASLGKRGGSMKMDGPCK